MKTILLFACAITLLTTTGCVVDDRAGGRGWGHDRYYHGGVIVACPAVVVAAPEVIVR